MIRKLIIIMLLFLPLLATAAVDKNASKALLSVTTYDQAGKLLHTGYGFFISRSGEAVSTFDLFKGASRAEVTDSKGKKWQVTRISGANDLYDVVKFLTDCSDATAFEPSEAQMKQGDAAYIIPNAGNKKASIIETKVEEIKTFENIAYYTLSAKADNAFAGFPVLNAQGKVTAILQKNVEKDKTKSYAMDIAYIHGFKMTALSAAQTALRDIPMPKQLPEDESQAASYLYLLSKSSDDSLSYLTGLTDYMAAHPDKVTGYTEHAAYAAARKQFNTAEADYSKALTTVTDKSEVHYNFSKLIYQLSMFKDYQKYKDWDLQKALTEAQEAYRISAQPLYMLQIGDCQYALKQYGDAFKTYQEVNKTSFVSPTTLFYAAKANEMAGGDSTVTLALLDSAVNRYPQPYTKVAAPFLLQRAQHYHQYGKYREASIDYKSYEDLAGTANLNDQFFYMKEQAELKAHLYQWALDDIDKALAIRPKEYLYLIEKAVIQARVSNFDEAIFMAREALKVNPNGADAYKVLGISYGEKGNKVEALKNLDKAKELGDPQAEDWIKSMKK